MDTLSPYYLLSSDDEDKVVQSIEKSIIFASASSVKSIPFSIVAENLERAYTTNRQDTKQKIAFNLMQEALHRPPEDQTIEVAALLRVCLPLYDNRSVYGFKTHKLLKSFAKALEKSGGFSGSNAAESLLTWIKRPIPVKHNTSLISMPEIAVAHAHSIRFPHSNINDKERLTLMDIATLCQRLTNMYKEKHVDVITATSAGEGKTLITNIKVDKIAEVLGSILPRIDYLECKILVRILLRNITLGIGVKTFMRAFLDRVLENRLDYQMDLCRAAIEIVNIVSGKSKKNDKKFICGVPFRSMTCELISSPYVMKWLFSKEESISDYLAPKDGKLIIHSNGRWYVPIKRSNSTKRNRFVDLEVNIDTMNQRNKKHMQVLKEIKRHKQLFLNEAVAYGKVISYIISKENDYNTFSFLVRGMKKIVDEEFDRDDISMDNDDTSDENELDNFVISEEIHPITYLNTTIYISIGSSSSKSTKVSEPKKVSKDGLIVQRKYDGDRMQAHLGLTHDGKPKVQLFSKSGKPVHHLYTDITNEFIKKISSYTAELPCILDGEIIVVDASKKPLPWSSTKWRYDSGNGGKKLDSLQPLPGNMNTSIISLIDETKYCENQSDGEYSDITLAPLVSLKLWDQFGTSEKGNINAKILDGAQLLFVIFDMIMLRGKYIAEQPYSERLRLLNSLNILSSLTYSSVIKDTSYIGNARELVIELTKSVHEKSEGLILKDPRAKYVFGKTNTQRKLKICGPDINCVVVGAGFTISKNPRSWGILTAILSNDKKELIVYNRVESIEGDSPNTALEHILSLPSCIPLETLKTHSGEYIDIGKYTISLSMRPSSDYCSVVWRSKEDDKYNCTLGFLHGIPSDIQWLCNPYECLFGISQRGDLHPIVCENSDENTTWIPRFPVCRIQLDDLQRSECDTPSSIMTKFTDACAEPTCIQEFLKRRVLQLRSKPPKVEKLEELRRILLGKMKPSEVWPQKVNTMYKLEEFSSMLIENGFETLTQGERHVLCGLPPRSQWEQMVVKNVPIIVSEEDISANYERNSELPFLTRKLREIIRSRDKKTLRAPIIMTGAQFPENETLKNILTTSDYEKNEIFTLPLIQTESWIQTPLRDDDGDFSEDEEEQRYVDDMEKSDKESNQTSTDLNQCLYEDDEYYE